MTLARLPISQSTMTSWLSNLEKQKQEENERKYRQEQSERVRREQDRLRGRRLKELYEDRYKSEIDAICESVNQFVSRAKVIGLGVVGGGGIHLTQDAFGTVSLRIAFIEGSSWSRKIEVFLEENGKIKIWYRWHVIGGDKKSEYLRVSIKSVNSSLIEDWIKWAVTGRREDWFSRVWRRIRGG